MPSFRPSDIDFALPYTNGTKPYKNDSCWPPLSGVFGEVEAEVFIATVIRVCQRNGDTFDTEVSRSSALAWIPNNFSFDKSMRRDVMSMSVMEWNYTARDAEDNGWCTLRNPDDEIGVRLTTACIEKLRTSPFSRVARF